MSKTPRSASNAPRSPFFAASCGHPAAHTPRGRARFTRGAKQGAAPRSARGRVPGRVPVLLLKRASRRGARTDLERGDARAVDAARTRDRRGRDGAVRERGGRERAERADRGDGLEHRAAVRLRRHLHAVGGFAGESERGRRAPGAVSIVASAARGCAKRRIPEPMASLSSRALPAAGVSRARVPRESSRRRTRRAR